MIAPFRIDAFATTILTEPACVRQVFDQTPALLLEDVIAPDLLARMMRMAAAANYLPDVIERVGRREIEANQTLGKLLNIVLARDSLRAWLEQATGRTPIGGISGRIGQTRPGTGEALDWHDDTNDARRRLAVVIHLSEQVYDGGVFELRRVGTTEPMVRFTDCRPGSMALFAVRADLEHRVTPLVSGGPRRVFAGWYMTEPEHPHHGMAPRL
jgi:hypothetical protein